MKSTSSHLYLPMICPSTRHWSLVHVSSRPLALLPQVRGLSLNACSPFAIAEPGSMRQKSKAALTVIGKCYFAVCCLFSSKTRSREREADDRTPK